MAVRFRVECARPGLEHAPGLLGDFDNIEQARAEARAFKASSPSHRVTIMRGQDAAWDEQPPERQHPHGHHFLASDEEPETIN